MSRLKVVPFFCDECGTELSTGSVCPECKRVLCHRHYFGSNMGVHRRKDGLCARCAEGRPSTGSGRGDGGSGRGLHEEDQQT